MSSQECVTCNVLYYFNVSLVGFVFKCRSFFQFSCGASALGEQGEQSFGASPLMTSERAHPQTSAYQEQGSSSSLLSTLAPVLGVPQVSLMLVCSLATGEGIIRRSHRVIE